MSKDRITVILGAGAMIEATGVSTASLTEKIIEECKEFKIDESSDKSLIEVILEEYLNLYSQGVNEEELNLKQISSIINFEEIFHILDILNSYLKGNTSPYKVFTNIKNRFSSSKVQQACYNTIRRIIEVINNEIYAYDSQFNNKGNNFKNFFTELVEKTNCKLDIFNLNYDTWIEQTLGEENYNDGFINSFVKLQNDVYDLKDLPIKACTIKRTVAKRFITKTYITQNINKKRIIIKKQDIIKVGKKRIITKEYNMKKCSIKRFIIKRFDINEYIKNNNKHSVSHLHGQIYFDYLPYKHSTSMGKDIDLKNSKTTLYKYNDYKIVENIRKNFTRSDFKMQAGEELIKTNIITGLMKTEKLLWNPLIAYHNKLANALLSNSKLIIIGYGYSDLYLNELLYQYQAANFKDRKIVMIDYIRELSSKDKNKLLFIELFFKDNVWYERYRFKPLTNVFYSKDKMACLYKNGFNDAINNINEIINFIK